MKHVFCLLLSSLMIAELPKKHENGGNAMGAVEVFSDGRSLAFPMLVG